MPSHFPLVTVISPCYNHSQFVIESLESIKNQTYPNIEHIIIDDCSTDDSVEKIEKWINDNNYNCKFIKHKVNKGISATLNESIVIAKGLFWSALATDDFAKVERTEKLFDLINKSNAYMVTSDCELIDLFGNSISINNTNSFLEYYLSKLNNNKIENYGKYCSLIKGNYIPSSLLIRKSVFEKTGLFDEALKTEDWDMWLRISAVSPIVHLDEKLTKYRWHSLNTIKTYKDFEKDTIKIYIKQGLLPFKNGCGLIFIKKVREVYRINCKDVWDKESHKLFKFSLSYFFILDYVVVRILKMQLIRLGLALKYKVFNKIKIL
ncbi:MAG: glycosyltransferase [Sphingomonadales bacterium]|jgi:glycosyltransferase involved in cell wall biosynthesis